MIISSQIKLDEKILVEHDFAVVYNVSGSVLPAVTILVAMTSRKIINNK